jgi:type VI protein secretion system component Hcp
VGEVLIRRVADAASAPLIATMALGKAPETVTIVHERTSPQGTKVAFLELELRQAVVIAVSHAGVAGGAATPVETVKLSAAQIRYTFRNDDGVTKSGQIG